MCRDIVKDVGFRILQTLYLPAYALLLSADGKFGRSCKFFSSDSGLAPDAGT
jgi:hypothetical protein